MNGLIYVLTNTVNGKQYVGQTTTTVEDRIRCHMAESRKEGTKNPIAVAIAKYGIDAFDTESFSAPIDNLGVIESDMIKRLDTVNNGYNVRTGGLGRGRLYKNGSVMFTARMDKAVLAELRKRAKNNGMSASLYLSNILETMFFG